MRTPPPADDDGGPPPGHWAPPDPPGSAEPTRPPGSAGPPAQPPPEPPGRPPSAPSEQPAPAASARPGPDPSGRPLPDAPARTNRFAIAALVTGVLGLAPFAAGFAIAALLQAGGRGEKGKGLAVGGLVASAAWVVAGVAAVITAAVSVTSVERDESGRVTGEDRVLLANLRAGDCFTGFQEDATETLVTALPCTRPHDGEVVAKPRLPGGAYPGDKEVSEQADEACFQQSIRLQKSRHSGKLEPYILWPDRTLWDAGDRDVICVMRYTGGTLTAPLGATLDPRLKLWNELAPGDCIGKWDDESLGQRTVPCTQPYLTQVFATFSLRSGPYPGKDKADTAAGDGCEQRRDKVFRGHRHPDLIWWLYPEEIEWGNGLRTAVCFGESEDGPLRKPMLPD